MIHRGIIFVVKGIVIRIIACLGFVLCAFTSAIGDSDINTNFFSYSLEELMDVQVVTASRYLQKAADVPANVTIITSKEIRLKGYISILDILRDVPMIDIKSTGQGYYTDIGGRGVNQRANMGKHWQMRIDGHDMTWQQFYRNHLSAAWVSVDNIERIEIIKGPASAVWGANAYLGVINIITKDIQNNQHGEVSFLGGSHDTYAVNGSVGEKFSEKGSIFTSVSFFQDDIPRKIKEWSIVKGDDVVLHGNESDFLNIYSKVKYGDFFLDGMISEDRSRHAISSFGVGAEDALFNIDKYYLDGGWKHEYERGSELTISAFYDRTAWGDDARYENSPFNGPLMPDTGDAESEAHFLRDMEAEDDIYGARIVSSMQLNDELVLLLGAEYEHQDITRWYYPSVWTVDNLEVPKFEIYDWGAYSQLTYAPIRQIDLVGGVRYDYNEIYKDTVNPRAAIVVKPSETLFWKIMYGRAYKAPSIHELFYYRKDAVYGNPAVNPEKNNTYETQITYFLKDVAQFSISGFYIDMKDQINYQTRTASQPLLGEEDFPASQLPTGTKNYRQQGNDGHYASRGIEAGIKYYPSDKLMFNVDATYREAVDKENNDSLLDFAARFKIVSSITYTMNCKYSLTLSGRYVGDQKCPNYLFQEAGYEFNMTEDNTLEVPAYFVSSLTLSIHNLMKNTDLMLKIENITDREYYDPAREVLYQQPELGFFAKLTHSF